MTTDHLDLEVKFDPGDAGTFTGRASLFGEPPDRYGDTIAPGAFKASLTEHAAAGTQPLMLWQHRADEPIGTWTSLRETRAALEVEGRLVLETQRGREAYELMRAGALNGLSIGFRTRKSEARRGGGRLLRDLELVEISVVTLPAASRARVLAVRNDPMSVDLSLPAGDAPEVAELPPDFLERITGIEAKIGPLPELAGRLDKIETRLARPGARIEVKEDREATELKAFLAWARRGLDGLSDVERKVLTAGPIGSPATDGFQLVPEVFSRELIRNLVEISPMRQVARVQNVTGGPVLVPKRTSNLTAAWVAETVEHGVSEPTYDQQSVGIFEARVTVEVTNQLLEDSAFDLSAELARDFAEEFARLEGAAFVEGDGTTQPEGFLTSADWVTTAAGIDSADDLVNLFYSVPSTYAARGTWLMSRNIMGVIRLYRSAADGPYVWVDSIAPGQPPTLLGRPVVEMPGLANPGAGSPITPVVAFGDWSSAYRIFDRVGLEVLRDPYTKARFSIVCFHARKRVGGALVNAEAVAGIT